MKKIYIYPSIEVVYANVSSSLMAGSEYTATGDYDLGDKTINPDDPRDDEGITGGNGDALSKGGFTSWNSWDDDEF